MKLYFSPLACSLATRIALYEAGASADYAEVDPKTKRLAGNGDAGEYLKIHALGLVPALALEDGELLTENAAVLQYVAERYPHARLAPSEALGRARLQEWLSFIGTELHKTVYIVLLDQAAPAEAKAYARSKATKRLAWVASRLECREFLLDRFSVADAYLFAVLNWSKVTGVELGPYPTLRAFMERMLARPAVERAFAEERTLYVRSLS